MEKFWFVFRTIFLVVGTITAIGFTIDWIDCKHLVDPKDPIKNYKYRATPWFILITWIVIVIVGVYHNS